MQPAQILNKLRDLVKAVSYTHLDVYKRHSTPSAKKNCKGTIFGILLCY